jgi:predicted metal-dependent phosphotriesterase family hydrolase
MPLVRTVRGDVPAEALGICYSHEHLLWRPPAPFCEQDPDLRLDSPRAALQEVGHFRQAGGGAIVEMTTGEVGRSAEELRAISEATGIHIVAATGHHKAKLSAHAVRGQPVDELARTMIDEIREGMDGTRVRAGVIKIASSAEGITDSEAKVIRAAGAAHRATGAPVSTHTEKGAYALEQIEGLRKAGVPPERMLIGHLDHWLDLDYHLAIAETGARLGFDQIGKEKYAPDSERIQLLRALLDAGYGEQIMLSGDQARKSNWPSYGFGNGPGLTYILWAFIPMMRRAGISQQAVETLLVHNPTRFFALG